jgi:hypothetical protein
MNTYLLTFTAGETKTLPGGNFLRLLSTTAGVDVEFYKNSVITEAAKDVSQGERFWPGFDPIDQYDLRFTKCRIISATAQTIKVGISMGESTSDSVTGTVNVGGIADPLTPDTVVSSYFRNTISSSLNTIVAPASNVNGIKVLFAAAHADYCVCRVMAKSSAPTSPNDVAAVGLAFVSTARTSAPEAGRYHLSKPVILPPLTGLFEQSNSAIYGSGADVIFEIL